MTSLDERGSTGGEQTEVGDPSAAAPRSSVELGPGTTLGRYVVLHRVGSGAMGVVYAAHDPKLDRRVAIKLLHADSEREGDGASVRLTREAQALARLAHPNVITVFDVGTHDGQVFVAMEYVSGPTLKQWVVREKPAWRAVLPVLAAAGRGLAAAHRAGVVHRDFKPDNVMVADDGRVLVMDFGLARPVERAPSEATAEELLRTGENDALSIDLTRSGLLLGTPAYMAPEQHLGLPADPGSDQYSYSISLYWALYGERPFAGETVAAISFQVLQGRVRRPPAGSKVPAFVRRVVLRGLAHRPENRWPGMDALVDALEHDPRTRTRRIALGLALVAAPVLAFGLGRGDAESRECAGASRHLAGVWDDSVRTRIDASLRESGVAYAEATADGVIERLDAYAGAWAAMHTQACEATAIHAEQSTQVLDLRMACLDARRRELGGVVAALEDADGEVASRAIMAATTLSGLEACADPARLDELALRPEDEQLRAQVDEVREQIARAAGLRRAGRFEPARESATAAGERAESLGYPPLIAETEWLRGDVDHALGDHDAAQAHLERAYYQALRTGHDAVAFEAANALVDLIGDGRQQFDAARPWDDAAQAWLERLGGGDEQQRVRAWTARGNMLLSAGRPADGREQYTRALELLEQSVPAGDPRIADALNSIAGALLGEGQPAQARAYFERALSIRESALGEMHPAVAATHNNLAIALASEADFDGALEHVLRALEIRRRVLPAGHPQLGSTLLNVSFVLSEAGRHAEALPYLEQAIEALEQSVGPEHPNVARARSNLGGTLLILGRPEEAVKHLRVAQAALEGALGPDHPDVGIVTMDLASAELGLDPAEALRLGERALTIQQGGQGLATDLAESRFVVARALAALGRDAARARQLAAQAREGLRGEPAADPTLAAEIDAWLTAHAE